MIYHNLKKKDPKQTFTLPELDKSTIITCIHCGAEYLAGEVYMPGALIGQPTQGVVRDVLGKIICVEYPDGKEPNKREHFTCEYCNKPFIITADIVYKSTEIPQEEDFSTEYVPLF